MFLLLWGSKSPSSHRSVCAALPKLHTGSPGKMCICRKCQVCFIFPNRYVKMILSVAKAAETVPEVRPKSI